MPLKFNDLDDKQRGWLVSLLSEADALFAPWRIVVDTASGARRGKGGWPACWERRRTYRDFGLRATGTGTAAQRKASERFITEVAEVGWITLELQDNRRHVRLVDEADDILRAVCGLQLASDTCFECLIIQALREQGRHNAGCVLEDDICELLQAAFESVGSDRYRCDLPQQRAQLEIDLRATLTRGILRSHSDTNSHVGYSLAVEIDQMPTPPPDLPDFCQRWAHHYDAMFQKFRKARKHWETNSREVVIPLSSGLWLRGGETP